MRYSESKTYIWYMIDGLCKLKCKEWQCTWERNWKSYSVRGRLHASTFALQYHLLPLFCPCFWIHVTKSLYFLLSIWLLNDWQEYVPTWNFDWIYDNDPFSTDDKKDKYAKTTTDPRGWALLLMSLLSPAVARYDSVYQLLTAFTSNHQVLTAFINGKCRFFSFIFGTHFL